MKEEYVKQHTRLLVFIGITYRTQLCYYPCQVKPPNLMRGSLFSQKYENNSKPVSTPVADTGLINPVSDSVFFEDFHTTVFFTGLALWGIHYHSLKKLL